MDHRCFIVDGSYLQQPYRGDLWGFPSVMSEGFPSSHSHPPSTGCRGALQAPCAPPVMGEPLRSVCTRVCSSPVWVEWFKAGGPGQAASQLASFTVPHSMEAVCGPSECSGFRGVARVHRSFRVKRALTGNPSHAYRLPPRHVGPKVQACLLGVRGV